jgi:hypothetical protein
MKDTDEFITDANLDRRTGLCGRLDRDAIVAEGLAKICLNSGDLVERHW